MKAPEDPAAKQAKLEQHLRIKRMIEEKGQKERQES